jgi:hypothetical protein
MLPLMLLGFVRLVMRIAMSKRERWRGKGHQRGDQQSGSVPKPPTEHPLNLLRRDKSEHAAQECVQGWNTCATGSAAWRRMSE